MQERPFSDREVQQALEGPSTVVLATINPDGSPLATPMWYVHDAKGIGMVSIEKRWGGAVVPNDRVLFRIDPRRVKLWG